MFAGICMTVVAEEVAPAGSSPIDLLPRNTSAASTVALVDR